MTEAALTPLPGPRAGLIGGRPPPHWARYISEHPGEFGCAPFHPLARDLSAYVARRLERGPRAAEMTARLAEWARSVFELRELEKGNERVLWWAIEQLAEAREDDRLPPIEAVLLEVSTRSKLPKFDYARALLVLEADAKDRQASERNRT